MIRVQGISKEYRSGRGRVQAITDVSFTIENNNTVAVFGKSGSGKTTLLNCLGGIELPEKGKITCFGVEIHSLSEKALCLFQRRNIGFVFQHGNLLSYLTVYQNIAFPLELNNFDKKAISKRVNELLLVAPIVIILVFTDLPSNSILTNMKVWSKTKNALNAMILIMI